MSRTSPTENTLSAKPSVKMTGSVEPHGRLQITLVHADGKKQVLHEDNLVVTTGKQHLLKALYLGSVTGPISSLHVGNGGTIDPNGQFPRTPTLSVTSLYHDLLSVPVTYTLGSDNSSVVFIADIDQSQLNGSLISEAGLFFSDGVMFNVKTFPGIPKTEDFSIHFEWTIRVN